MLSRLPARTEHWSEQAMNTPKSVGMILVLAVAGGVVALWMKNSNPQPAVEPEIRTITTPRSDETQVIDEASDRQSLPPETIPVAEPPAPEVAVSTEPVPEAIQAANIQSAIEATVAGHLDPGAFLDTALALSKLEVRKNPIPEANAFGAIRYPVLGTPEGVTAELWLRYSNNTKFGNPVMTYHVTVPPPEGYVLEGVARGGLQAEITLWTDGHGNVKNFGVLTESKVAYKQSQERGLQWRTGIVPTGVLFSYDPNSPFDWAAKNCGLKDGSPWESAHSAAIVSGKWPQTDSLDLLKTSLLNIHSKL